MERTLNGDLNEQCLQKDWGLAGCVEYTPEVDTPEAGERRAVSRRQSRMTCERDVSWVSIVPADYYQGYIGRVCRLTFMGYGFV